MCEQVKQASAREVCGSVKVEGKNPKRVWWNNEVKAAVRKKEAAWKEVWQLAVKRQNKDVWKCTERRRERLKGVYITAKSK